MNIRKLVSEFRVQGSISNLESVLEAFRVDIKFDDSRDSGYLEYLRDSVERHNLRSFIFDVTAFNRQDADWRRLLKEMETKWVSFYGAHKVGPNQYVRDQNRLFVGTRNLDFIPQDKWPKGVMESGTEWDMIGNEKKQDYVRFFDRVRGEWRSTVKTYMVGKGEIPEEEQIPYDDYIAKYGRPVQPPPSN